jgi:S1-C subfamily serine protease
MRIAKAAKMETAFGIEVEGGVDVDGGLPFISRILPQSSASKSDLQLCDLVLTINGQVSLLFVCRC